MQALRIGIHGLGRIGRAIYRQHLAHPELDVVMINDLNLDADNQAYLLNHDSVYGLLAQPVTAHADHLRHQDRQISLSHCADPRHAPWQAHGVDVIIDAAGHTDLAGLAEWAYPGWTISTRASTDARISTCVFGVNDHTLDLAHQRRLSSSICDTVALAPLAQLLEQHFGLEYGRLTTLHPWLGNQRLLDGAALGSNDGQDSHLTLGRAAFNNLLPKTTSAVTAADAVLPGLSARIQALSFRVPTQIVSSAVLDVRLGRASNTQAINHLLQDAASRQTHTVLSVGRDAKVSLDYRGNPHSACVDLRWTSVERQHDLRLLYWYDNEWGYSARVIDLLRKLHRQVHA